MSTEVTEPKNVKEKVKEPKKAKAFVTDDKIKAGKKAKKVKKEKSIKKDKVKEESIEEKVIKEANTTNYPKFRYWLMDNKITQKDLANRTHLSVNTVYRLTHFGNGTKSIIKLVAMELDISESKLIDMLKP